MHFVSYACEILDNAVFVRAGDYDTRYIASCEGFLKGFKVSDTIFLGNDGKFYTMEFGISLYYVSHPRSDRR